MKRNITIFIAIIAAANIAYWGYQWSKPETYESCLIKAAKNSHGVILAYDDLRDFCNQKKDLVHQRKLSDAEVFGTGITRQPIFKEFMGKLDGESGQPANHPNQSGKQSNP